MEAQGSAGEEDSIKSSSDSSPSEVSLPLPLPQHVFFSLPFEFTFSILQLSLSGILGVGENHFCFFLSASAAQGTAERPARSEIISGTSRQRQRC